MKQIEDYLLEDCGTRRPHDPDTGTRDDVYTGAGMEPREAANNAICQAAEDGYDVAGISNNMSRKEEICAKCYAAMGGKPLLFTPYCSKCYTQQCYVRLYIRQAPSHITESGTDDSIIKRAYAAIVDATTRLTTCLAHWRAPLSGQ